MALKAPKNTKTPVRVRIVEPSESSKPLKTYVSFSETQLPDIVDWQVGDQYDLLVSVRQVSLEERGWDPDKGKMEARFEVLSVKPRSTAASSGVGGLKKPEEK